MSEHQETLAQVVKRIDILRQDQHYSEKTISTAFRPAKQLVELQARIEAGEAGKSVKWWAWYAANFKNRSRRRRPAGMALRKVQTPGAAAEEERAKNRAAVAAHRKRAGNGRATTRGHDLQ